jgi:hypothetical protein
MARTAQYTEQVSLLVSEEMKAFLLGSALAESVSEADVIRTLLDSAVTALHYDGHISSTEMETRAKAGRQVLAERRAGRSGRQTLVGDGAVDGD